MAKSIIFFAKYYVLIVVKSEKLLTQRYVYVANQLLLLNILYEKIYMSYIQIAKFIERANIWVDYHFSQYCVYFVSHCIQNTILLISTDVVFVLF